MRPWLNWLSRVHCLEFVKMLKLGSRTLSVAVHVFNERCSFLGTSAVNNIDIVRFQVLTAASMKFRIVFWDVLPCKIIVDRRFRGACCL
jgi:hypothetical protein